MITYTGGSFGINLLLRIHGSALYKAFTLSLVSALFYTAMFYAYARDERPKTIFLHPYPMGALIAAFTFLLTFKASFSYQRYWEACTVVHTMHAKWLDVGLSLSSWHLQSDRYKKKPPSFGSHPEINAITKERERLNCMTMEELKEYMDKLKVQKSVRTNILQLFGTIRKPTNLLVSPAASRLSENGSGELSPSSVYSDRRPTINENVNFRRSADTSTIVTSVGSATYQSDPTFASRISILQAIINEETESSPSLFLQEAAHLISLLSAVALSTLRNDLPEADCPLAKYVPNQPWPNVDPDYESVNLRKGWKSENEYWVATRFLFGFSRTPKQRTLYNAGRPFRVIGGVSDSEIRSINRCRGPLAKIALCSAWLNEYISREHLHGSTGGIQPPIISRAYQLISDGMLAYNQARKIAYIPFPFPHAQITSFFVVVVVFFIPILMLDFVINPVFGAFLDFFAVLALAGLHEVSRELENPFVNVPNDIPLNNFQAQFNEALNTMYTGYHPDSWWVVANESGQPIRSESNDNSIPKEIPTNLTPTLEVDDEDDESVLFDSSLVQSPPDERISSKTDARSNTDQTTCASASMVVDGELDKETKDESQAEEGSEEEFESLQQPMKTSVVNDAFKN